MAVNGKLNNSNVASSEIPLWTPTNMPPASAKFPRGDPDNLFGVDGKINMQSLQNHFAAEGRLSKKVLVKIVRMAATVLAEEPCLLRLEHPVFIVGDIHGQYYDLLRLFQLTGSPLSVNYLFLGDYVDRGSFGVECLIHLLALKVNYPNNVFLLRGNHESAKMTGVFTHRTECYSKAGPAFYQTNLFVFRCMPLAAVVDNRLFCCHGCISPHQFSLNAIERLNRFCEVPSQGVMCDLLWADPVRADTLQTPDFAPNMTRQCSFLISHRAINVFLRKNKLLAIVRAHEVMKKGLKVYDHNPWTGFPSIFTVFSAPNYCDVYNNHAAVLYYDRKSLQAFPFEAVPHPCVLPDLINGFSWTLPYVVKTVHSIFYYLLNPSTDESDRIHSTAPVHTLEGSRQLLNESEEIILDTKTAPDCRIPTKDTEWMFAKLNEISDQTEAALKWKGVTPTGYSIFTRDHRFDALEEETEVNFESAQDMDSPKESWKKS